MTPLLLLASYGNRFSCVSDRSMADEASYSNRIHLAGSLNYARTADVKYSAVNEDHTYSALHASGDVRFY